MAVMEIRSEFQQNAVADDVGALVAVIRPVIAGVLHSIRAEMLVGANHTRESLPLKMLGRLRKQGDGDCGIAFEYAVHDAVMTQEPIASERVAEALKLCRIAKGAPASILFAVEKAGSQQLISTHVDLITNESRVLSGARGQPVKLKNHMSSLASAFRRPRARAQLPQSIRGLWKADLFLGSQERDHWVGTSVKINPQHLEAARGLRVAIIPSFAGRSDAIKKDESKNLVICPLPHDGSFMQVFYEGWRVVQALCETDFAMPREVDIPTPVHREAARVFIERREFPIVDVLDATAKFSQPELLTTRDILVDSVAFQESRAPETSTIVGPIARLI